MVRSLRAFVVAFVCTAVVLVPHSARSDDTTLDLDALTAKIDAATGKKPLNFTRVIRRTFEDQVSDVVTHRIGDDERTDRDDGDFSTAAGTYHGLTWYQNENGQTSIDRPAAGREAKVSTTTTVRFDAAQKRYTISTLDNRGFGRQKTVDATTWRVVSVETKDALGSELTTFSEYRTSDGYTQPYAWTVSRGGGTPIAYSLARFEVGTAKPSDVAMPGSKRLLVQLPAGISSVNIPVTVDDDAFIVRVTINGRGLDFQLDTGSAGISIDEKVAKELGLTFHGGEINDENAGVYHEHEVRVPELTVGPLPMHDIAMRTHPDLRNELPGQYKVVGLLGFDFIADLLLKLDYEHHTLTAYDPEHFDFPSGVQPVPIDIRIGDAVPMSDIVVNGKLGERFVVDTGAQGSIIVNDYFMQHYPDVLSPRDNRYIPVDFNGVGGRFEVQPVIFDSVKVGSINFADFLGFKITSPRVYRGFDGVIGTEFLRLFTVYLDYEYSHIYLERNRLSPDR